MCPVFQRKLRFREVKTLARGQPASECHVGIENQDPGSGPQGGGRGAGAVRRLSWARSTGSQASLVVPQVFVGYPPGPPRSPGLILMSVGGKACAERRVVRAAAAPSPQLRMGPRESHLPV